MGVRFFLLLLPAAHCQFAVIDGSCTAQGMCVHSPSYPASYGTSESCTIASLATPLIVTTFQTDTVSDFLLINGVRYASRLGSPNGVVPIGAIVWTSDSTVGTGGSWELCHNPTPSPLIPPASMPPLPPPMPPPMPPQPPPMPPLRPPMPSPPQPPPLPPPLSPSTMSIDLSDWPVNGWSTGSATTREFTHTTGTTPSPYTGPSNGLSSGYYLFAEASGRAQGDVFSLSYDGAACAAYSGIESVTFRYHMRGVDMGRLDLLDGVGLGLVWSKDGQQTTSLTSWDTA